MSLVCILLEDMTGREVGVEGVGSFGMEVFRLKKKSQYMKDTSFVLSVHEYFIIPWTPNGLPDKLLSAIDLVRASTPQLVGGEPAPMNKEAAAFERAYRPNWQYH